MLESSFYESYRPDACVIIKKEIPEQEFSCEFYEILRTLVLQNIIASKAPHSTNNYHLRTTKKELCF